MASPVDTPGTPPAPAVARLAGQAGQALQQLPQRLHPAWVQAVGANPALLSTGGPGLLNLALLARFDLRWPDLSAASHALELAWLLPRDELGRLCAARALYAFRGTLARTVDAGLRRAARALVGSAAFQALVQLPAPRRDSHVLPATEADAARLAGWAMLKQGLPWRDLRSRRLVELMLPPAVTGTSPPTDPDADPAADHVAFASAVPILFPEHAWLFGSEPASWTSA